MVDGSDRVGSTHACRSNKPQRGHWLLSCSTRLRCPTHQDVTPWRARESRRPTGHDTHAHASSAGRTTTFVVVWTESRLGLAPRTACCCVLFRIAKGGRASLRFIELRGYPAPRADDHDRPGDGVLRGDVKQVVLPQRCADREDSHNVLPSS